MHISELAAGFIFGVVFTMVVLIFAALWSQREKKEGDEDAKKSKE